MQPTNNRYAIHLIAAANLVAQRRKAQEVDESDVVRSFQLFSDVQRSTKFLQEFQNEFVFSEIAVDDEQMTD